MFQNFRLLRQHSPTPRQTSNAETLTKIEFHNFLPFSVTKKKSFRARSLSLASLSFVHSPRFFTIPNNYRSNWNGTKLERRFQASQFEMQHCTHEASQRKKKKNFSDSPSNSVSSCETGK